MYSAVCPAIESLRGVSSSREDILPLLEEVVKIYGMVAEYSKDHNYMYCFYHYLMSPKPPPALQALSQALLSIGSQEGVRDGSFRAEDAIPAFLSNVLSPKRAEAFFYRLLSCHLEETYGNGDPFPLRSGFSSKRQRERKLFSAYKKLPPAARKQYSNEMRRAYLKLEQSSPPPQALRKNRWRGVLFPMAFAEEAPRKCLIGGVLRDTVFWEGRHLCSSHNNSCGEGDNFKCGPVFNSLCIKREPSGSLSRRCYEAAQNRSIDESGFQAYREGTGAIVEEYCQGGGSRSACAAYRDRMKEIDSQLLAESDPAPTVPVPGNDRASVGALESKTEAEALCLDGQCESPDRPSSFQPVAEAFRLVMSASPSAMGSKLANRIMENSDCKCGDNAPCVRGCSIDGRSPTNRCKSPDFTDTGKCMKYVTGAIMKTIDEFISPHCGEFDKEDCNHVFCDTQKLCERPEDDPDRQRDQCFQQRCAPLDDGETANICNQSVSLPHALCALNLDGQDRLEAYSEDKSESASQLVGEMNGEARQRNYYDECVDAEKENNKNLKSFTFEGRQMPLFIESENSLKENGDLDLSQLRDGDIVVMKSGSRSGHIEIKVPKEKCMLGEDDPRLCFCSDFCEPREASPATFQPLVVFRFNPELSHLLSAQGAGGGPGGEKPLSLGLLIKLVFV